MATIPLSKRKTQRIAFAIFCGWTGFIVLFYHFTLNFNISISVFDSLCCNVLLALGCMTFSNVLGYYQPKNDLTLYVLVIAFMLSLLIVFLMQLTLQHLIHDPTYISFLRLSLPFRFLLVFVFLAWCALANLLWYRLEEQSEMQKRLLTTQNLAKEAELNKLRHQLQPHFLFNSLNSVYALTIVNPKEAGPMITRLASFLRGTLKRDDDIWVSVAEEMEYIQLYLDIEKVRFSHRLNLDIQVDEATLDWKLPGTLLQPIVENAIKFGLYNTAAAITISIVVTVEQQVLTFVVQNPYDPGNITSVGTGFGLNAIRRRLYLLFADNNLLQTRSTADNQFITTLRIPPHDNNNSDRR
jgi:two-component system LytT family sensor kinase